MEQMTKIKYRETKQESSCTCIVEMGSKHYGQYVTAIPMETPEPAKNRWKMSKTERKQYK